MMAGMTPRAFDDPADGEPSLMGGVPAADAAGALEGVPASGPLAVIITGEDWLDRICPFLRARDGSWRSASPVREHRCWATDPPSELPVLTQQRLCLVAEHDGCERFLHARELRSASLARDRSGGAVARSDSRSRPRSSRRAGGRVTTVAAGMTARLLAAPRLAIGAVVGAILVAVVALVVVGGSGVRGPAPSDGPAVSQAPGSQAVSPDVGDPSPGPDGLRRYRVRPGDTLRTIAERFGISVRQLRSVNDLGDPPRLEPGDIILVPQPG